MTTQVRAELRTGILGALTAFPGSTCREVCELMGEVPLGTVSSAVHYMRKAGLVKVLEKRTVITETGRERRVPTYGVNPDNTPDNVNSYGRRPRQSRGPTPPALEHRVQELEAQLNELRQWKADAIRRYPDLAVDPMVLRARKMVAEEAAAGGDHKLADDIRAGVKDTILPMRIAIKMLEELQNG